MILLYIALFTPLLCSIIIGALGFKILKKLSGWVASTSILVSFLTFFLLLISTGNSTQEYSLFNWISIGNISIPFGFLLDRLSLIMSAAVSFVSFWVHVYSIFYINDDPGYPRYFAYLNLFVFFMLLLVLANNYLVFFIGWEGVGLCSYLLIGYWHKRDTASKAGVKAFVVNRIGDAGFLIGIFILLSTFETLQYTQIKSSISPYYIPALYGAGLFLFIGAIGKSAQFPLYIWLPDAMEGPTPVSALIHAATMVTAGVYMVARNAFIYSQIPLLGEGIATIGVFTAFFSALMALNEQDLKRILAYSTISQLGYMFIGVGLAGYTYGLFHLITHAFFKALLFLCAGAIMHALSGELNIFKMGKLGNTLKMTNFLFFIGALGLAGIPPLGGFFSKESILHHSLSLGKYYIFWVGSLTALLTSIYIFRAYFTVFYGGKREKGHKLHQLGKGWTIPMLVLSLFVFISAFFNVGGILESFLAPIFPEIHLKEITYPQIIGLTPLFLGIAGILIAFYVYGIEYISHFKIRSKFPIIYKVLFNKFYWDKLLSVFFTKLLNRITIFIHSITELGFIDRIVNITGRISILMGRIFSKFQTGSLSFYARVFWTAIVLLLWLYWSKVLG